MDIEKIKKKKYLIIFVLFVLLTVFLKFWQVYYWSTAVIELKEQRLNVLVADTYARQYKGLGGRETLGNYDGMIFTYGVDDKYGIVMRDMSFPIDIVWLNKGEVIDIAPNVQVEPGVKEPNLRVYRPRKSGNAVLELRAGWVEANDLKIGDKLAVISD